MIQCVFQFLTKRRWVLSYLEESIRIVQKAFVYPQHVHSLSGQSQIEKRIGRYGSEHVISDKSSSIFSKDQYIVIDHWMDFESESFIFGLFLVAEAVPYVGLDHWKIAFDSWVGIKSG